jgi:GT2 family glycosyltransferase
MTDGPGPTVAVVTLARDRRDHLSRQRRAMADQTRRPDRYVVVDLGGDPIEHDGDAEIVSMPTSGALPLAAARNTGASVADADVTIFLDVDCVPAPTLVADYADRIGEGDAIVCGPVGYLPTIAEAAFWNGDGTVAVETLRCLATYQDGRPRPGDPPQRSPRWELLWSLSFAIDRRSWKCIGGFDERYVGYGAEDTDFAWRARDAGVALVFTGAAEAFHQHHAVSSPPIEHLHDIVHNSTTFHDTWGEWPMVGWLTRFSDMGVIDWSPTAQHILTHIPDQLSRRSAAS